MKILVVLALAVACASASQPDNTAYGYIQKVAIPLAEEIRKAEEANAAERIVGGSAAELGQIPYQAGLLARYQGLDGTGVCGGFIVKADRVITAAHCWFDGMNQANLFTVVLGSVTLFSGGVRLDTSHVITHPNWFPLLVRNDVAVIHLPSPVVFSGTIAPVALPSESQSQETFAGETGRASGFGLTSDGGAITATQSLSYVDVNIISNSICFLTHPLYLQNSNICTSSRQAASVCRGDSGGPLVVTRDNGPIVVGITSFGSVLGCAAGVPAVYARVTSFLDFFNQHL